MTLVLDTGAAARRLSDDEFRAWAETQTVFLSSVMGELSAERAAVAKRLKGVGVRVRWFEEFGGRDDSAEAAYLSEVEASTIYVGLLGDEYGTMLATAPNAGFSATHAEYLAACRLGKRISFWVREDGSARNGHARTFLSEVQVFHTTGRFRTATDLAASVEQRLRELAGDDLSPWVKLGDVVIRADRVRASGNTLTLRARVYTSQVVRALEDMAGQGQAWGGREGQVTFANRSGVGRIEDLAVETSSGAFDDIEATVRADFTSARGMRAGTGGLGPNDITEAGLRAGLFGEALPANLGGMAFMVTTTDPLAELKPLTVPEGAVPGVARLLLAEHLIGSREAAAIEGFSLGPRSNATRQLELSWREPREAINVEPGLRTIRGACPWP